MTGKLVMQTSYVYLDICYVLMSIYTVHLKEHGCSGNLASKSCILDDVVANELRELRE